MNPIKILITKTFIPKAQNITKLCSLKSDVLLTSPIIDHICSYSNIITNKASSYPGFVDTQSYWDLGGHFMSTKSDNITNITVDNKIITISEWKTIENWFNWFDSEDRKNINKKYDFLDIKTQTSHLFPKLVFEDVALL